nr:peptidase M61 [Ignavibacteria bacterium]
VGLDFGGGAKEKEFSLGTQAIDFDMKTKRIYIKSDDIDEFGKSLGLKQGDQYTKVNGKALEVSKIQSIINDFFTKAVEGEDVEIEVARKDADGNEKLVLLKGKMKMVTAEGKPEVKLSKNPTEEQLRLRKAWMGS